MNYYPIPGANINPAYFYANPSYQLGCYEKPVNSKRLMSVDYTQLIPTVTISKYSFLIDQGGSPPLVIDDTKLITNILTFSIAKGVPGTTYSIGILAWYTDSSGVLQKRTDYLDLSVPDEDDCCNPTINSQNQQNLAPFLTGDNVLFANDVPRYFVSSTAPQGPNLLDMWYNPVTGLYEQYVSTGATAFWHDFTGPIGATGAIGPMGPIGPIGSIGPPGATNGILYYVATAGQTVFPLSTRDLFGNYILKLSPNIFVYRNGTLLTLDNGTGVGGYTVNITANTITLLYPAGAGELISIIYPVPVITSTVSASTLVTQPVSVISTNNFSPLSYSADGNIGILFVNQQAFSYPDVQFFNLQITWNSTIFSVGTSDNVFALYSHR